MDDMHLRWLQYNRVGRRADGEPPEARRVLEHRAERAAAVRGGVRPVRALAAQTLEAAVARSVSAEMHSGFAPLREEFPMYFVNIREGVTPSEKARADMQRIVDIWRDCRARFSAGGEFLFGTFSAADAMFAPVASRFNTYRIDLAQFGDDGIAARYRDSMMAMPEMLAWAEDARKEG